jgi:hypothetical protein
VEEQFVQSLVAASDGEVRKPVKTEVHNDRQAINNDRLAINKLNTAKTKIDHCIGHITSYSSKISELNTARTHQNIDQLKHTGEADITQTSER